MKAILGTAIALGLLCFCAGNMALAEDNDSEIKLPDPVYRGKVNLEKAICERNSVRDYKNKPLAIEDLGQLLWAGQGILSQAGHRTTPSAGAKYPMTLFVAKGDGLWKYVPKKHLLKKVSDKNIMKKLAEASLGQRSVSRAPVIIILAADVNVTAKKYKTRATRYCDLEAGHIAQNIALQATARQIGLVTIGAFKDGEIRTLLNLPDHFRICYVLPVGYMVSKKNNKSIVR